MVIHTTWAIETDRDPDLRERVRARTNADTTQGETESHTRSILYKLMAPIK